MPRPSPRARRALLQLTPVIVIAALVGIVASDSGGSRDKRARKRDELSGTVSIDGAAALRGLVDRAAERFETRHPEVRVTVGASGDGNAIAIFCTGEVDIAAVARRLDRTERRSCRSADTRYVPIEVAREGIALVVSEQNDFVRCLRLGQVRAIWRRTDPLDTWGDVNPRFPPAPLDAVGSKPDGTPYTLMAEALFGPADPLTRNDYTVADDPVDLRDTVAASPDRVGFLPVTQIGSKAGVRPVAVDAGHGCVTPTPDSVRDGSYRVLSRPLYLTVNTDAAKSPAVRRFIAEYLKRPPRIRRSDGMVSVRRLHRLYRKFTRP